MMSFTDIGKNLGELYSSRQEPAGIRALAELYWRTLLVCAALVVVLALVWGLWQLFAVFAVLSSVPDTSPLPPAVLNRAKLQGIVQEFGARESEYQTLQSNPPAALPDPSK